MSRWLSDIFTFEDARGDQFVSAVLIRGAMNIRRFNATGPAMPIRWPQPTPVVDSAAWLDQKRRNGFQFVSVTV